MENTKAIMVLIVATVLIAGMVQAAEQPQAKLSSTRQASCLVKVSCDPVFLPLGFETIDYLLHSSGVGGKAVREVLNISIDQVPGDYCTIEYVQELISNAAPKSSIERSSGPDGMDEYEYAMRMEMEAQYKEMPMGRTMPSTTSPRRVGSFPSTRKTPSVGRTITATMTSPDEEQTYLFSLNIQLSLEVKPAAEELMDALLQNLRNALTGAFDEHMQKLNQQLRFADDEAARTEEDLRQKQAAIRSVCGSNVFDRDMIAASIGRLRAEIQQVKMNQMSDEVMVETATKQIAEIQDKLKEQIDKDMVTKQLTELLVMRERSLENVEKLSDSGRASGAEVADAREKLARARIELAQRSEELSKSKGGDLIESLNKTLADRSVKIAEYQAYLSSYEQQLAEAESLLDKVDVYELLSLKTEIAKQNLQEAIIWRDRVSRQVRMLRPPTVSMIGGD
jgi:hypothetical protein